MKDPHKSSRINELEGAKPGVYWANLTYFDGIFSVCIGPATRCDEMDNFLAILSF